MTTRRLLTTRVRRDGTSYRCAKKGDPEFGPVCKCGGRKSKQALTCQACHNIVRGYGTVPVAEQNRRWRMKYLGIVGAVGNEDTGRRAAQLAEARGAAVGELATLIAEQERDSRANRIGAAWAVSLDAVDAYGRTLHERVAA